MEREIKMKGEREWVRGTERDSRTGGVERGANEEMGREEFG